MGRSSDLFALVFEIVEWCLVIAMMIEGLGDVLEGATEILRDLCTECGHPDCSTTQSGDFGAHVHTNHYGPQIDGPPDRN